jgi:hypothetical protein
MEVAGSDAEFKSLMKAYAKKIGMKTYLKGEQVEAAQELSYEMSFEKKSKGRGKTRKKAPVETWWE